MPQKFTTVKTEREWSEFGHTFRIDRIEPLQIGASIRHYRLYDNGEPAFGHQWHSCLEYAQEWAQYILKQSYADRIEWLESRVMELEKRLVAVGVT